MRYLRTSASIFTIALALAFSSGPARASIHHAHYSQWSQNGRYWPEPTPRIIRRKRYVIHHVNHRHRRHHFRNAYWHHWRTSDDRHNQGVHRTQTSTKHLEK